MPNKRCSKCRVEKSYDDFHKHCRTKDGYAYDCRVCHGISVKQSRVNNPDKYLQYGRDYYKKRYQNPEIRRKILDNNTAYNKTHTKEILEQARKRRFRKAGKPLTPKPFVFYRDVIVHWMKLDAETAAPKWQQLLALPLTDKQRTVVQMAMKGIGVAEASIILKKQQSTITKTWNGDDNHNGGIMRKVKKYAPHLLGDDYVPDSKKNPKEDKRKNFEDVMRIYFPPEKFPYLWCNQECKMTDINSTKQAALLLEYKKLLDTQILELRARACELAAKSREISKLIPEEQIQEVVEQEEADAGWSGKGIIPEMMKGNK